METTIKLTSWSIAWNRQEIDGNGYPFTAQSIRLALSSLRFVNEFAKLSNTGLPPIVNRQDLESGGPLNLNLIVS